MDYQTNACSFYGDVIAGLSQNQKSIPPKYFYDQRGSRLFDALCHTREYYPTRTEMSILTEHADEIGAVVGYNSVLIEPGSGSSQKVRLLLKALRPHTYAPLDISSSYLLEVSSALALDYPELHVSAACVDFTRKLQLPPIPACIRRVVFFPGSSIGNFEPDAAKTFLTHMAEVAGPGGGLLIGVDLKKELSVLKAAYNDAEGITAEFNLNVLRRINNELGANFNLKLFQHHAFYNEQVGRIEMHLRSRCDQLSTLAETRIQFDSGETIHTENSYKYTIEEFQALAGRAGFSPSAVWTDRQKWFSVMYFIVT